MINICYSLRFITAGKVMRTALQIIRSAFIFRREFVEQHLHLYMNITIFDTIVITSWEQMFYYL